MGHGNTLPNGGSACDLGCVAVEGVSWGNSVSGAPNFVAYTWDSHQGCNGTVSDDWGAVQSAAPLTT